ncbi:PREDICTED: uncharacterized protein LOC109221518 [Nicotiana attenuata]|uniref:uncharacterized protein LOC109221518 n=1 Tax=Nicotiana attenuata TaxID=49451 RepID=UPI0009049C49|nr:PREDICTED: uncharacterized protein LOC109221518 [Nicotiana attenuata]
MGITLYLLVYVDDIVVTGNNETTINNIKDTLSKRFSLKDLGLLHFFLGVEVLSSADGLIFSQYNYILDVLKEFSMEESKGVHSPLSTSTQLKLDDGSPLTDAKQYRSPIGKLQYLAFTRPDISYVVNKLSQFMHRPTVIHWTGVKRVLRYLKQTITHGLFFKKQSDHALHIYSDADWAGDLTDRSSTSAYVIYLGLNPISWSSKKQHSIARSSTEAEYRAVAGAVAEGNWTMNLLSELYVPISTTPTVYCDNIGTTYLCQKPVFHSRMKHIAIDFHLVCDQVY